MIKALGAAWAFVIDAISFLSIIVFLAHKAEIRHPDPKAAVYMALMIVMSTLFEVVVMPTDLGPMKQMLPDDAGLKRELT